MSVEKIRVGITQGDINGIGYEVIFKTLNEPKVYEDFTPIIYGSSKVAAYHRKALNMPAITLNSIKSIEEANDKRINIINCLDDNIRVELGKSTQMGGEAAFLALKLAVEDLKRGAIDVLVTAPINKKNIQSEEFHFPGHTEYLMEAFHAKEVLMLMVSDIMKVGVVAGHIAIKDVPAYITKERILEKLRIMNKTLQNDFTIRRPRIAVLGLNPHMGDDGLMGNEEQEVIIPAMEQAKAEGIMAMGPYAADGLFGSEGLRKFDAILAMYHDQGLTPFKTLAFSSGVNYTGGLDGIRTSPDHGTAFEIAGLDQANHESFQNALFMAIDIFKNRKMNVELQKNPLKTFKINEIERNA